VSTGWQVLPNGSEVLAVHAAMLHTGRILYFAGDEHDRNQHMESQLDHTRLFNCGTLQVEPAPSPTTDVFCAGHAMLADGRLLVAGGTESFPMEMETIHEGFTGLRDTWIFGPGPKTWVHAASLCPEPGKSTGGGRWYPTLVTLSDGRVMAAGGNPMQIDSRMVNNAPETFRPTPSPQGQWELIGADDPQNQLAKYPRLHVLPDGRIFSATPTKGAGNRRLNAETAAWAEVCAPPSGAFYRGFRYTSVLLPLLPSRRHRPQVLLLGGKQPLVIDLGVSSPSWTPTGPRTLAGTPVRIHANAVPLPTGDVFVCGGVTATGEDSDTKAVMGAELYRPTTNRWFTLEPATVVRNYHSVAQLMPDGRVWTARLEPQRHAKLPGARRGQPRAPDRALRTEVCRTVASRDHGRPHHDHVWTAVHPRDTAGRLHPSGRPDPHRLGHARLQLRPALRGLPVRAVRPEPARRERSPPTSAIAPPGYYLLFVVKQNGVPSEGRFVRVRRA
jgi:Domain of unknown function (DUF1929)